MSTCVVCMCLQNVIMRDISVVVRGIFMYVGEVYVWSIGGCVCVQVSMCVVCMGLH